MLLLPNCKPLQPLSPHSLNTHPENDTCEQSCSACSPPLHHVGETSVRAQPERRYKGVHLHLQLVTFNPFKHARAPQDTATPASHASQAAQSSTVTPTQKKLRCQLRPPRYLPVWHRSASPPSTVSRSHPSAAMPVELSRVEQAMTLATDIVPTEIPAVLWRENVHLFACATAPASTVKP
jgi:hypothetical protein